MIDERGAGGGYLILSSVNFFVFLYLGKGFGEGEFIFRVFIV